MVALIIYIIAALFSITYIYLTGCAAQDTIPKHFTLTILIMCIGKW